MAMEGYQLNLNVKYHRRITTIDFKSRTPLNSRNYKSFISKVLEFCWGDSKVVIDFNRVIRMDSAGLSALIYLHKKLGNGTSRLAFANLNNNILFLIQSCGLEKFFNVYNSLSEAVTHLKSKNGKQFYQDAILVLQLKRTDSYLIVKIKEPNFINKRNCERFRKKIEEYSLKNSSIIINFDNIRSIDNEGIAMLIDLKIYAKQNEKEFILVYSNRILRRLFKMYSVEEILPHYEHHREAIFTISCNHRFKTEALIA